jgi:hypothetical protein
MRYANVRTCIMARKLKNMENNKQAIGPGILREN